MHVVPNERFLSFLNYRLGHLFGMGFLWFSLLCVHINVASAQLVINEVSQGPSGNQEYIELLVTGTPTCSSIPTVDLRGWYIDDNNGFHANGSGTGIATGCVRFSQSAQWANVKIGTLILIYNDLDKNSSVPADDETDNNKDCIYVIPISSTLFERNELSPDVSSSSYPTSGFSSGGLWSVISMANDNDSFQLIDPTNLSKSDFSVSWGNNTSSTVIYFGISVSATVLYMTNSSSDDPTKQSNWTSGSSPSDETPGQPNNNANASWISSMNNNCQVLIPIAATLTSTDESCGNKDGLVSATVTGGTSPYTYSWSNGKTTSSISNLAAGSYTVTVTDANGCTDNASVTINNSAGPTVVITGNDESCGDNNGSATTNVSGGTSPYTYSWSNGKTTSSISNLAAGTYSLTVTDKSGCTTTDNVTISNTSGPTVTVNATDASCGNTNGSATTNVSGGTSPYTYSWSNGKTTSSITNVSSGSYTLTVTDKNGCTVSANATINSTNGPSVSISPIDASCGNNNGMASASVSSGVSPYTYSWSNGKTTASISNLSAGTYSLTVTDANGCTDNASVTISSNNGPSLTTSSTDASCGSNTGTASVAISGGTLPYTYSWSNGKTTASISNLAAGSYSITVTDDNGCTATAFATVNNSSGPTLTTTPVDASCGNSNGSATVTATGGTSPYTYSWSNGASTSSATNLAAGSYTITVTDKNGCTTTATATINNTGGATATTSVVDASCGNSNGSATVTATGGTSPYTYSWSNGKTTASITNVAAGSYTVTVTDKNGCTTTASATINNTAAPSITITAVDASCGNNNGSATASISGGKSPYTYLWSNGKKTSSITKLSSGTYSLTVTDANGCTATSSVTINSTTAPAITSSVTDASCGQNDGAASITVSGGTSPYTYSWSNGATSASISNVSSGSYTLTVTDKNSCVSTSTVNINNNGGPTLTPTSIDATCGQSNGSASISVSGGSSPYTYSWSNGASTSSATNLAAGSYTLTVTDANNCNASSTIVINDQGNISLTSTTTDAACGQANGSATTSASGGTSPYSYLWSNAQTSASINNLLAGNYSVIVMDANGCSANDTLTILDNGSTSATTTTVDATCGQSNGSATVTVTGGTSPYTYLWSDGQTTTTASNLASGSYTITVTDANGCSATATATINNTGGATAITTTIDATCGQSNGSATVTVTGGTSPYTYLWSNGASTSSATNLATGSYTVTLTDANGCSATATATINNTGGATATTTTIDATCGQSNGSATVTVTGGTSPYTYLWSDGQTTATAGNLASGSFSVTVTDANGCSATATVNINNTGASTLATTTIDATCGQNNGSATVTATGGTAPYIYLWSDGQTTATAGNLASGNYSVTVIDVNGCTTTTSLIINASSTPHLTLTSTPDSCNNAVGLASVSVVGGSGIYSYLWNNTITQTNSSINNLSSGWNYVMVDDGNCQIIDSVFINNIPAPTITLSATEEHCASFDGTATVLATGGSGIYSYLWNTIPAQTNATASNLSAGNYSVIVDDGNCIASGSVVVNSSPILVTSNFIFDQQSTTSDLNTTVTFFNQSSNAQSIYWDFGDGYSSNLSDPYHVYSDTGTYRVMQIATDQNGCMDTTYSTIIIDAEFAFFIPNTFTPNGDKKK